MPLWGNTGNSSGLGAPKWQVVPTHANATGINCYANATLAAYVNNEVIGVFAVDNANSYQTRHDIGSPGWVIFTHGTGGVASATIAGGTNFANGETFEVTGGTKTAVLTVTTNPSSVPTSLTVTDPGAGFTKSTVLVKTASREQHITGKGVTGSMVDAYNNSDYVVFSNGTTDAYANIETDISGAFTVTGVTVTSNGLWANTKIDADIQVDIFAANGAITNGTGLTISATLGTSSAGTITPILGGRAGRLQNEVLVSLHLAKDAGATLPVK